MSTLPRAVTSILLSTLLAACDRNAPAPSAEPSTEPPAAAQAAPPPLLARELLFGNPERANGQISPDGRWLGYIAPRDGVLNVYVAPADDPQAAKPVTNDRLRGIRGYAFAFTGNHVLYGQDIGGDENFQVFLVDLATGEEKTLTPKGSRASIAALSPKHPNEAILSVNDRDPMYFDLLRVNLRTGEQKRLFENKEFLNVIVDRDFELRYAAKQTADGGQELFVRDGDGWRSLVQDPARGRADDRPRGHDHRRQDDLHARQPRPQHQRIVRDRLGDRRPAPRARGRARGRRRRDGASGNGCRAGGCGQLFAQRMEGIDPAIAGDLEKLKEIGDGEVNVGSRTLADDKWVVVLTSSTAPPRVFLYDRTAGTTKHWFDVRPALAGATTAPMHTAEIKSRDGLTLPSYYTLPPESDPDGDGKPATPVPTVLFVHGGPWGRDGYGFNSMHQWLANRGYAALAVNFRGSTGFGKEFTNAGDLEWGRKMHDDLLDGVEWAVKEGIAQEDMVAIMGGSYGGYATLAGMTMTPTEFACGVDIVGPSNLVTLLSTIPPYWGPQKRLFQTRVGDDSTEDGRKLLTERSPLTFAHQIQRPLLIGQGANDPRVKQAESDQIVHRDAGEEHSGDLHPLSRRRARIRSAAEQSVVSSGGGGVPRDVPRRARRAGGR